MVAELWYMQSRIVAQLFKILKKYVEFYIWIIMLNIKVKKKVSKFTRYLKSSFDKINLGFIIRKKNENSKKSLKM